VRNYKYYTEGFDDLVWDRFESFVLSSAAVDTPKWAMKVCHVHLFFRVNLPLDRQRTTLTAVDRRFRPLRYAALLSSTFEAQVL
jgi:hypothetical protein